MTFPGRVIAVMALTLVVSASSLTLTACGTGRPPQIGSPSPTSVPTIPTDPAGQLAGLAAAAQDRTFVAGYTLKTSGRADRTIVASVATDGSWSVNVPGGALSGGADVSMVGTAKGTTYQCVLGGPATSLSTVKSTRTPTGSPSPSSSPTGPPPFAAPACVKIANGPTDIPAAYDPVVEHPFTDWLTVLSNRNAPISVFAATKLRGASGTCFSVEPSAASLAPVVEPGIFCFLPDGTLTAARLAIGTLTLIGTPAAAPPADSLPAPVTSGPAAPLTQTTS